MPITQEELDRKKRFEEAKKAAIPFDQAVIRMIKRGDKEEMEKWKSLFGPEKLKEIWDKHKNESKT